MDDSCWEFNLKRFDRLNEAIKDLDQVDPRDPVWDLLSGQLQELFILVQQKLKERVEAKWERTKTRDLINHTLRKLLDKHKRLIDFLEIESIASVDGLACDSEKEITRALSVLSEIGHLLDEYEECEKTNPANKTDRRNLEARRSSIEERLDELKDELLKILPPDGSQEPGDSSKAMADYRGDLHPTQQRESGSQEAQETTSNELSEAVGVGEELGESQKSDAAATNGTMNALDHSDPIIVDKTPEHLTEDTDIRDEGKPNVLSTAGQQIDGEDPVWQHYREGRFAEAYWLSYGLHSDDGKDFGPLHNLLLACALQQGVGCVSRQDDFVDLVTELVRVYQRVPTPVDALSDLGLTKKEATMLAVTASLSAALLEPASGALGWLQQGTVTDIPYAHTVGQLSEFASKAAWMDLKGLICRGQKVSVTDEVQEIREAAAKWLATARTARFSYLPARAAMRYLASPSGPLGSLMEAICAGQRLVNVDDRFQMIPSSDMQCVELLEQALRSVEKPGADITGESRSRILRMIAEAGAICRRYENSLKAAVVDESQDYREYVLREFVKILVANLPNETDMVSLETERAKALFVGLKTEIDRVVGLLTGNHGAPSHWLRDLQAPLLRLDEVPITPDEPLPENLNYEQTGTLVKALEDPLPWREVALSHARRKDFYSASLVLEHLKSIEPSEAEETARTVDEMYREARRELTEKLEELRNAIEAATIDSTLSEQDKAVFDSVVQGIEGSEDLRVHRLLAEIDEWSQDLNSRRRARAKALREHLDELKTEIASAKEDAITAAASLYAQKASDALEKDDTLLADEYLGRAEDILRTRTGYSEPEDEEEETEDWAALFLDVAENLREALDRDANLVRRALIRGQSIAGIGTGGLAGTRRSEIQSALDALAYIKQRPKAKDRKNLHHDIAVLMAYLGFLDVGTVQSVKGGDDYHHFRVKVGLFQRSPLPQFGSGLNGTCDVVVVWDRPDEHTLSGLLKQLGVKNPLVLYLGRMTRKQRQDWGTLCRETRLTALLVDDILIHFLAGQRKNRLHACVSCAMLWGYANPYSFSGPIVPPEVFQGREKVIQEIEDSLGSAVLYGGRQLGKSACLREFARRYQRPAFNQYVVYRDIKQVGKPGADSHPASVWKHVARGLYEAGFPVSAKASVDDVVSAVKAQVASKPDLRIWVLLDEADDFLRVDGSSKSPFTVVQQLKALMDSTGRRFKVVFSGLHSVQKYCTIPNHPFAHFKAPIVIGPLDPRSAIRLIKEPLSTLGFRFSSDDPVYRILAYANSHPALIQLFCSELVNMATKTAPPYKVTVDMVEMVFRNQEVRGRMRERFEWTLDLDDRYAVLAYAIIDAQRDMQDGYRQEFSVEECLHEARVAWPAAFNSIDEEECRSLLDELTGLGILVRTGRGYRLRNANIVTALGSKAEVQDKLRVLGQKQPPSREIALDRRTRFEDSDGWRPLTLAQEATLLKNPTSISFIFGSSALGLDRVKDGLKEIFGSRNEKGERDVHTLVPECACLASLQTWLRGRLVSKGSPTLVPIAAEQLLLFPEPLVDVVLGIQQGMQEKSPKRQVVLAVLFGPSEIAVWYRLPQSDRDRILAVVGQPLVIRKWEAHAVEMMLRDEGFLGGAAVVDVVRRATSGWPSLLHELYASPQHRDHSDPRPEARALRVAIVKDLKITRQFISSTGFKAVAYGEELAKFVAEMEPIQPCDIELMESPPVAPEVRAASFRALVDLGIVEPETVARRKGTKGQRGDEPRALVLDPLVKELLAGM